MVTKNILLVEFNEILFSRKLAEKVFKEKVETEMNIENVFFCFDFSGVLTITHSFADEFFKILFSNIGCDDIKKKTTFKNYSGFNEKVLTMAMNNNKNIC
jgi:hypothetical protein